MGKSRIAKKRYQLFFAIALFIMLLFCFAAAFSGKTVAYAAPQEYTPVVTVEQKRVYCGQTFSIDVDLSENEGILDLFLTLSYDSSVMRLIGLERGTALRSLTYYNTNTETAAGYSITPFNMFWDGTSTADKGNGTIVTLIFESFVDAPVGVYPINLTYDPKNTNKAYKDKIDIDVNNGSVTLVNGDFWAAYYDWNGVELFRKEYRTGQTPTYEGELPSREDDERYSYSFNGWIGMISDEESTLKYQAEYLSTPKRYQVFYYADGINADSFDGIVTKDDLWRAEAVDYGTYLENEYPTKPRYVFSGWYVDEDCSEPFSLTHMPAENISLYGYFVYDIRTTSIPKIQLVSSVEDNIVTVYADMVKNTGFNSMVLTLDYDKTALKFLGPGEPKEVFSGMNPDVTYKDDETEYDDMEFFKVYYGHTENSYATGVFYELKFEIRPEADTGVYGVTFVMENTDASYINGNNGIRYTQIEIIGTQIPVGKLYRWEKSVEDSAEVSVVSDTGLPADTMLKVSLVPDSVHKIDEETVQSVVGKYMEIKAVYDLKLMRVLGYLETEIDPDGNVTVEIKLTPEQQKSNKLGLYSVGENGEMVSHEFERDGDVIRFVTSKLDRWAIVGEMPTANGKLSDAAVMLISMPILLAIVTLGYALIIIGKKKKEMEKEKEKIDV